MEPWRVCKPVVAEPDHFDEEQKLEPGPDPDPHKNDKWIRILVKSLFRIRIKWCRPQHRSALTFIMTIIFKTFAVSTSLNRTKTLNFNEFFEKKTV